MRRMHQVVDTVPQHLVPLDISVKQYTIDMGLEQAGINPSFHCPPKI